MKALKRILLITILGIFCNTAYSQALIQNFSLINVTDNKTVSLSDYKSSKGVVLIFTNTYCAYSKLYEDRIFHLAKDYISNGIAFIMINPGKNSETIEDMQKKAKNASVSLPYLADKDLRVSKMLKASKTPQAILLKPEGDSFKIIYSGAIDDNPQVVTDVKQFYLKDAIDAVLKNKLPSVPSTKPVGCMIDLEQ